MKDNNPTDHESPIKFPCDFTIKVVGKANREFENAVMQIMQQYFPQFGRHNYKKRLSRDANYLAYTITIYVIDKPMLDAIYQSLSRSAEILFVL
jgi:putative lipoic acid-binding regulatory protein